VSLLTGKFLTKTHIKSSALRGVETFTISCFTPNEKNRNEVNNNNNNNNNNAPLPKYFVTITYSLITSDEQQSD
jgi:NifB/MoaA-like Fe-S oxidoreductase